ncbi:MAG: molybdate ABC transporter substrate-binding protein [Candidatus Competibacteraceae bacterium]|nr:molybdate ABC transporter substrate-binding protein [Candidatus Competibacteraceae bacterium]
MRRIFTLIGLLLVVPVWAADPITVFAAASTTNAIQDIAALYQKEKGVEVKTSFAAASALAKQIEQGAPADVFISADLKWMDYLDGKDKIVKTSRRNLLGNQLVLIAPKGKVFPVKLEKIFDLPGAFEGRWCSCVQSVPIGQYSQQALTALGWWAALEPRLAAAPDVRSALAFVERGECAVGIVYATDAKVSDKVEVLATFPPNSHSPVLYPAALVQGAKPAAKGFLEFLASSQAAAIFSRYGFTVIK